MGEGRTEGLVCVWREWRVVVPRESGQDEARRLLKQGTNDLCRATSVGSEGEREGPGKVQGRFREVQGRSVHWACATGAFLSVHSSTQARLGTEEGPRPVPTGPPGPPSSR
jgi:hypothetical protein